VSKIVNFKKFTRRAIPMVGATVAVAVAVEEASK